MKQRVSKSFHVCGLLVYPWKHQKTRRFLMFLETSSIKWVQQFSCTLEKSKVTTIAYVTRCDFFGVFSKIWWGVSFCSNLKVRLTHWLVYKDWSRFFIMRFLILVVFSLFTGNMDLLLEIQSRIVNQTISHGNDVVRAYSISFD